MLLQVRCINKQDRYNPHSRIINIGGINPNGTRWKLPEDQAIRDIESGKYSFYVIVGGRSVKIIIAFHEGRKYLKTEADGITPNNLLSLPECP